MMIEFPDPNLADDEGLIAMGGELTPEFLLSAYLQGIFPWFCEDEPILWWSPNPRMVLLPQEFKLNKSLRQVINKGTFELRVDTAFREVITSCSKIKRSHEDETWITNDIIEAYVKLHELGYAHSFESYFEGELAGGLYGLSFGNCFFGESMFFTKSDASKVAFYHLVQFVLKHQFAFIDAQQPTNHLASLGARPIPRKDFLEMLEVASQKESLQGKWTDLV
ncbi:leucyl/phenylalanyl-tRNA--protein transferase [Maribellus sp. CM-23]|uniref:leucyl/phenylalanyl-tRNA--protein transferase n=1 Tax=Maribellus sp. CM-23 TaxID=2781026 RepID=UPI001F2BA62C|nr:leucyl/phenylalanyl-tRNA--protein transferase [Maribellus sp. CM-23]MCE4565455.1 leucyl/phenylalanyl-tRNA--protein transferase [Maribellus sp. CM-23]